MQIMVLDALIAVVTLGGLMVALVGLWKAVIGSIRGVKSLFRKDVERVVQKDPSR